MAPVVGRAHVLWLALLAAHARSDDDVQHPSAQFTARIGGVAVGSRVTRGPDWRYGIQDAGRSTGTVLELARWRGSDDVLAVRVRWDGDGSLHRYRWAVASDHPRDVTVVGEVAGDASAAVAAGWESSEAEALRLRDKLRASPGTVALLAALYDGLDGAQWTARGWHVANHAAAPAPAAPAATHAGDARPRALFNDPCLDFWDGVVCVDGALFALDLANAALRGSLAGVAAALPGDARRALATVTSLNLAGNALTGVLPATLLCAMPALQFLDLSGNALTGTLPPCLAALPQLAVVNLATNDLAGVIPPGFGAARASGAHLQMLLLHGNARLTHPLPHDLHAIATLYVAAGVPQRTPAPPSPRTRTRARMQDTACRLATPWRAPPCTCCG